MKDIFIKLTRRGIPVYINIRNIVDIYFFANGETAIQTVIETYTVKETQEEVIQIINKEQQRWL